MDGAQDRSSVWLYHLFCITRDYFCVQSNLVMLSYANFPFQMINWVTCRNVHCSLGISGSPLEHPVDQLSASARVPRLICNDVSL